MNIMVKVLNSNGGATLVEWNDATGTHRGTLPKDVVHPFGDGFAVQEDILTLAAPYGYPWEMLPLGSVGAERVAQSLRDYGIWTVADARARVAVVRAAIQAAYRSDVEQFFAMLRREEKNQEE